MPAAGLRRLLDLPRFLPAFLLLVFFQLDFVLPAFVPLFLRAVFFLAIDRHRGEKVIGKVSRSPSWLRSHTLSAEGSASAMSVSS